MEFNEIQLKITKGAFRVCRLRDEYYTFLDEPENFAADLKDHGVKADLFTFIQQIQDRTARFSYHLEFDSATVLPLSTYEHWWKRQINDKTRNMVRKAAKSGVELRLAEFDDTLVRGIETIYNETPVRQGRLFKHYGKSFETLRREHETFLERSQFVGAYHANQLIGFVKLFHGRGVSNLMNIIAMISHRDKAVTNALIAKAVEICTARGIPYLQYGTGNSRSIGAFKKHNAFEVFLVPRYFVPLNVKGVAMLRLGLHRPFQDRIPASWRDRLTVFRGKWLAFRFRDRERMSSGAPSKEKLA